MPDPHNAAIDEVLAIIDERIAHWRWKRGDKPMGQVETELHLLRSKILARRK